MSNEITAVIDNHDAEAQAYINGNESAIDSLVTKVLKRVSGARNPATIQAKLKAELRQRGQ